MSQLNVRISPETRQQLDALVKKFGESEGRVISRLIEREYHKEVPMKTTVSISDLSERAIREAEKMEEGRPVYARPCGRGYELTQIHFIDPHLDQYEKDEQRLFSDGWKKIDFCQ